MLLLVLQAATRSPRRAGSTAPHSPWNPALNHLFIAGTGKSLPAEYLIPSHVAEHVIRDIADFIKR